MKLRLFTFFIAIMVLQTSYSQRNCGSMEYLEQQSLDNPKRMDKLRQLEQYTRDYLANNPSRNAVVTIPVVVHVVYNNSTENISVSQINSQMQVLNDDFRRLNSDADGTWSQAADTEIEFCLATVDPNGNPTNRITRTSTSVTSFSTNDNVKFNSSGGKNAWPAGDYMNFWVCDLGGGLLGYAQFPGGPASTDGIVVDYQYFGTNGTATAPFDLGRTATHEVGHYLNLRHIWGDGPCSADDFVADTPASDASNGGCALGHVSCGSVDMVQNYMDYSNDACMNLFTAGQRDRMQALFGPGGSRVSLLSSGGCGTPPTPSCTDGIQNGDETGVDCGGTSCPPCSGGCSDTEVTMDILLDNYPGETTWALTNSSGATVVSGGPYSTAGGSVIVVECLPDGCYDFTINDSYGDGICCGYGNGAYSVYSGSNTYASGGQFGSVETANFCVGGNPPTCNDGVQNGDETGVDCGGSSCPACPTCSDGVQNGDETGIDCGGSSCPACPTCDDGIQNGDETGVDCGGSCDPCGSGGSTTILGSYFESGWDGWIDGGSDCYRYSGSRSWEGNYSIRIRDNSGTSSSMTSPDLDLSGYSSVEIEFYFYAYSMENGEDFWVRYNDGSGYQTVAAYARGTNFNNNTFYVATVTLNSGTYNLVNDAKIRFQCDASGNADHVYIDAVTITGISGSRGSGQEASIHQLSVNNMEVDVEDLSISPNPVSNFLQINSLSEMNVINVYNLSGQLVLSKNLKKVKSYELNVQEYETGMYILSVESDDEIITKRFVKN